MSHSMTTSNLKNSRLLLALRKEPVDRTPVWIMRQAGRYLPEYRETRKKAGDFLTLCRTPELACEVTMQPLRRYQLDAAIIFSDILVIPDAMGLELRLVESIGPVFEKPVQEPAAVKKLGVPDPETDLGYVLDAIRTTKTSLDGLVPLIGFSGSPWTLAVYMIEGRSKTDFSKILSFAKNNPEEVHILLETLSKSVSIYLEAQARAGADVLMVFDTWGGILNTDQYLNFSLHYMNKIVQYLSHLMPNLPVILFTKGSDEWLEHIAETGCHCIGLDWNTDIGKARGRVGSDVALQGNLNPAALREDKDSIQQKTKAILQSFGAGSGHIFNLGHGITPDIDPEHVAVMIDTVQNESSQYHN